MWPLKRIGEKEVCGVERRRKKSEWSDEKSEDASAAFRCGRGEGAVQCGGRVGGRKG